MSITNEIYESYIKILKEELVPAMGCTEPIALAYAAAKAKEVLGELPERIRVDASGSIIKNVKSVIVPNTNHLKGIGAAVAAGTVAGDASRELEVIASVSEAQIEDIKKFLDSTPIEISCADSGLTFDIKVTMYKGDHSSIVRIANYHTNIVYVKKDDQVMVDIPVQDENEEGLTDRSIMNMKDICEFVDMVNIEDVREVIERQIRYNTAIAEEGMRNDYGANIGKVLMKMEGDSVRTRAKAMAAAGSDARMNGCEMPVIINSGSGNQGITCCMPVIEYAKEFKVSEDKLYRALVLSNLVAIYQKSGIGRLSAYCGAVSAGAAAGAGITYIQGYGYVEIKHTVVNALAVVSGMVCDGAKASCAAKIAMAVDAGILGFEMYKNGQQFYGGDGIVAKGVDATIKNIGCLGKDGMRETNQTIIDMMMHC